MGRPSAFDKAAELLARRPHFRAQLAAKLAARGYPGDETAAALERLTELGYVDDRRTARDFVAARQARGPVGRRRLAAELVRHGAPAEVVDEALAELPPGDELTTVRAAAERWTARASRPGKPADPRALARHLGRLGFGSGAIWEVLRERAADAPTDD